MLAGLTAAALLPTLSPATADSGEASEMRVESFVLPLGAAKPSLEDLRAGDGMEQLDRLAREMEPEARIAPETMGPAASFAPKARQASATSGTAATERVGAVSARAVTYPEPSRTMTYEECRNGLGADKKFFIKSRFAVCSGATFLQTWFRNNRPVGESMFNVRTVGTIAANSREIKFQYYFTEMQRTGQTATAAMKITTSGAIPKSWPSRVKYDQGGNLPKTAKTSDELKAARTYTHTMNAKPGQGSSGTTDLVFAVYEPSVAITPPAGWRRAPPPSAT